MKVFIFIILTLAGVLFLPEQHIANVLTRHYHISGDGEEAINRLATLTLLIKLLISMAVAFVLTKRCEYQNL